METESPEEMRSEIARHHRDFAKISEICDRALWGPFSDYVTIEGQLRHALKRIRNIVG